jgi:hypothetical protein
MRNAARDAGYPTLLAAGLEKVREGMIAPDELLQLLPDPG